MIACVPSQYPRHTEGQLKCHWTITEGVFRLSFSNLPCLVILNTYTSSHLKNPHNTSSWIYFRILFSSPHQSSHTSRYPKQPSHHVFQNNPHIPSSEKPPQHVILNLFQDLLFPASPINSHITSSEKPPHLVILNLFQDPLLPATPIIHTSTYNSIDTQLF